MLRDLEPKWLIENHASLKQQHLQQQQQQQQHHHHHHHRHHHHQQQQQQQQQQQPKKRNSCIVGMIPIFPGHTIQIRWNLLRNPLKLRLPGKRKTGNVFFLRLLTPCHIFPGVFLCQSILAFKRKRCVFQESFHWRYSNHPWWSVQIGTATAVGTALEDDVCLFKSSCDL